MSRPRSPFPTPRLHKGAAVVDVYDGGARRTITLGRWGSAEAQQEYERLLARLRAVPIPQAGRSADLTVAELLLAYIEFKDRLLPDQAKGGTNPRFALRTVRELYGALPAVEFGPRCLKAARSAWVEEGLSRKVVNGRTGAVRRVFRWGVSEEILPVEVYQRLQTVEGLRTGQTSAPDLPPVRPAELADVEAAIPHMPTPVRGLALLQLHTAARAGELVRLRTCDIDRTDPDVWTYTPVAHKTAWKGKGRTVYFGERSRLILQPLIDQAEPEAYLFSPARAEQERNAARSAGRSTPRYPSHMRRNEAKRVGAERKRPPKQRYTTGTYRRAIERACDDAFTPAGELGRRAGESKRKWWARLTAEQRREVRAWQEAHRFTPHRLRHLAATRARAEFGVDVARALCGHSLASVTEVYSRDVDRQLALQAVRKFG